MSTWFMTAAADESSSQKGLDLESGEIYSKPAQKTVKEYFMGFLSSGWRQFQGMVGLRNDEIITVQEIIKGTSKSALVLLHFL